MSDTNTPMTQAEHDQWVREQFQRANKHLAENGVLFDSVVVEESRYLAPYVAVWKIKSQQGKYFWVLSGDLPADYIPFDTAPDVRSALKHSSKYRRLTDIPRIDDPEVAAATIRELLLNSIDFLLSDLHPGCR